MLVFATAAYALLGVIVGLYGLAQAQLLVLALRRRERPAVSWVADADCPVVTVQLPIYNEPAVVAGLLRCVARLDWPADRLEIQILDDSTDDTPDRVRAALDGLPGVSFHHIRRGDRAGFKAGALAAGLARARGSLIAILDADFRPEPDFLRRIVPRLEDGVGLVQGRWSWLNRDENLFTRLLAFHLDAHFAVEQTARAAGDLVFGFNGTAGVWRRQCIEDAGGWEGDTLTEDLDLAVRARLAGWELRYAEDIAVPSEIPAELAAIRTQQHRWMKGGAQVARKLLPTVWRREGWRVRLQAVAHLCGGGLFGAVVGIAVLLPVLLVTAAAGPPGLAVAIGIASLPMQCTLAALVCVYGVACAKRSGWRGLVRLVLVFPVFLSFSAALAIHNAAAVASGWWGTASPFVRTPKRGATGRRGPRGPVPPVVWAELALGLWLLVAVASPGVDGHGLSRLFALVQAAGLLGLAAVTLGWQRAGAVVVGAGLALGLGELGLRALEPAEERGAAFAVEPGGWVRADAAMGYVGAEGRFAVRFADGWTTQVTHGADGLRITAPVAGFGARGGAAGPTLEVHGGSFAHGLGLDDAQTLPWRLQEALPGWTVRNRAVSGYGPLQAWIALDQAIAVGDAPAAFVVAYAGFQDERVTQVRNWRRSMRAWVPGGMPSTRTLWGTPRVEHRGAGLQVWTLADRSALAARGSRVADRLEDAVASSHGVSRNLLVQLGRRGAEHGVRVVIAGLSDDPWTADTLAWCARRGIEVVDVGLPWTEPRWNLEPHDGHPNAAAAAAWAEGIAAAIAGP